MQHYKILVDHEGATATVNAESFTIEDHYLKFWSNGEVIAVCAPGWLTMGKNE